MSNTTREDLVADFHEAMGQPMGQHLPEMLQHPTDNNLIALRFKLIDEEVEELRSATVQYYLAPTVVNLENVLKELADVQYVLSGFAVTYGLNLDEAFKRVHESNMSKLVDGRPLKREDGKVLKGPNYAPPSLTDLVTYVA